MKAVILSTVVACLFLVACGGSDDDETRPTWTDPTTNLTWQNPPGGSDISWDRLSAIWYCGELDFGGHTDWRLPSIDELRTLVRNCPATDAGGSCNIGKDGCMAWSCCHDSCSGCASSVGTDDDCFWPEELTGDCTLLWSRSQDWDPEPDLRGWLVNFSEGSVYSEGSHYSHIVRCVR